MKRIILALLILFITLFHTGCWSLKEINDLSIVTAIAFDKVTDDDDSIFKISFLILKGGGEKKENGSGQGTVSNTWILSETGINMNETMQSMYNRMPRTMFLSNANIIIVGEKLAREDGVDKVLDVLMRNKDLRLRAYMLVSKGEAVEILKTQPELESIEPNEITGIIDEISHNILTSYVSDIKQFVVCLLNDGEEAVTGRIELFSVPEKPFSPADELSPKKSIVLRGSSIFRDSKLVGWLNDVETKGLYIVDSRKSSRLRTTIDVMQSDDPKESFSFEMIKSEERIIPVIEDNNISITIEIKAKGVLGSVEDGMLIKESEHIEILEKITEDEIKHIVELAIKKSKSVKADIFGFGNSIRHKNLHAWRKVKNNWEDIYPNIPVNVNVEVRISKTKVIVNPIKFLKGDMKE